MMISSYFNSRMIGEYVYEVVSQLAYMIYDTIVLPKIYSNEGIKDIEASRSIDTSDNKIKMGDLEGLAFIKEIELS